MRRKVFYWVLFSLPWLLLLSFLTFVWVSDSLESRGRSNYDGEYKRMIVGLVNTSRTNLHIKKVAVNEGEEPSESYFVTSYSGQLVSAGIEDNPLADFIPIGEGIVRPGLSGLSNEKLKQLLIPKSKTIHIQPR